ncbi:NDP-sugar pyrophosphorylase family protein [Aequitasia blattaphilus]|uniref:Sugar phosphate nucleotidyltransferase n=1 Tax=Aequitasia blattaphilus TaxID=2949332 RepID=A0ABT1E4X6_9FIRM|nr:sugar phosphate nucleotidyltransferase [Aequitasia blattaphilus]MCP1100885.1 sugar phosphate nucleotidyltransferase [Aequitasia blattaphilus]MCR8613525.1 sugar phosphate nucleotidyltransferase [Aequitasia blattaphilus]
MKKPILLIMAAGMGSRYGGLKQIDPVDSAGHIIMDYSIYDAKRAGFEDVVFIIKRENEESFKEAIGNRISKHMKVHYCYQEVSQVPSEFEVPKDRVKPWGTAHAVLACKEVVEGPFVVINADDFYGREAFQLVYDFLMKTEEDEVYRYAMVGYELRNTVTDNGSVSRGVCELSPEKELLSITERTRIEKRNGEIAYTLDEGETYHVLPEDTLVSMNMWGFSKSLMEEIERGFRDFLKETLQSNPLKGEYYLPGVVSRLMEEKRASVKVLKTADKWYGITYKEDKKEVEEGLSNMRSQGIYEANLLE